MRMLALLAAGACLALDAFAPLASSARPARGYAPRVLPELPATPQDLTRRVANNSPMLAVDSLDRRFVVLAHRQDAPAFSCGLQVSGDRGRNWLGVQAVRPLPRGAERCYAPEVAFDREGTLFYLFVGLRSRGNTPMGAFLTTSRDRGRTFSKPRRILGGHRYMVRMAIDPDAGRAGRIHLVWLQANSPPPTGGLPPPPNPILSAYSDDGGSSFSRPVRVSDADRPLSVAPALALGPQGQVHVLYYDHVDDVRDYQGREGSAWSGNWSLVSATSNDGGRTFGRGTLVDDRLVPPERVMLIFTMPPPALAADERGRLFAAWDDARNGDRDVFLKRSPDGGRTWGRSARLNDDPAEDGSHQYMPRVAVSSSGRVDAIFYDRRNNMQNRGNDVYLTFSTDGGRTFSPNVRVTRQDSDSRIGPRYGVPSASGLVEFGSRIGLVASPDRAIAAWTDTRHTAPGGPTAQDIFATHLVFGAPGTQTGRRSAPPWLPLAIIAALAAAAALAAFARKRRKAGPGESAA